MSLLSETAGLESTLLRLKIIFSDLPQNSNSKKILEWINNEIEGYPSNTIVPYYRRYTGRPEGSYVANNVYKYDNALVPLRMSNLSEDQINKILTMKLSNPIKDIEVMSQQGESIGIPVPTEILSMASSFELQILSLTTTLSPNELKTIVTKVKNTLVDIILELEKNFKDIDSLDISEELEEDPEKSINIVNFIYTKIVDNSVEIGNDNKIKKSLIGHVFKGKGN